MASQNRPPEQHNHNRYQLKDTFYVIIQRDFCGTPARVADLSKNRVGFYSVGESKKLTDKFILLDLVTDNDSVEAQNRYGLQFINLSALQKKQLGIITKKTRLVQRGQQSSLTERWNYPHGSLERMSEIPPIRGVSFFYPQ